MLLLAPPWSIRDAPRTSGSPYVFRSFIFVRTSGRSSRPAAKNEAGATIHLKSKMAIDLNLQDMSGARGNYEPEAGEAGSARGSFHAAVAVFGILVLACCSIIFVLGMCKKRAGSANEIQEESVEETQKKRAEQINKELIVMEWAVDEQQSNPSMAAFASEEDGNDSLQAASSVPKSAAQTWNRQILQPTCDYGSDDCESESLSRTGGPDCAICLAPFEVNQFVCKSNNASCDNHIFHAGCMISWLLKHEECPMCRETYLLAAV